MSTVIDNAGNSQQEDAAMDAVEDDDEEESGRHLRESSSRALENLGDSTDDEVDIIGGTCNCEECRTAAGPIVLDPGDDKPRDDDNPSEPESESPRVARVTKIIDPKKGRGQGQRAEALKNRAALKKAKDDAKEVEKNAKEVEKKAKEDLKKAKADANEAEKKAKEDLKKANEKAKAARQEKKRGAPKAKTVAKGAPTVASTSKAEPAAKRPKRSKLAPDAKILLPVAPHERSTEGEEQSYLLDCEKVYVAGCSNKRSPDYLQIMRQVKAEIEDHLLVSRAAVKIRIAELAEPAEDES